MSNVTEDIVGNLIKSNYEYLKSFAELINAEVTEEGRDDETREKYKEDVSKILSTFGECEANLRKGIVCLQQTKNDLYRNVAADGEECDRQQLMSDIDEIINVIEGRSRNDEEPVYDMQVDENRIVQLLEKVEDILTQFHPLKFRDDDDDEDEDESVNEREEQKISKVLDEFKNETLKKLELSMGANLNENAMEVDDNNSDSEDDEEIAPEAGPSNLNTSKNNREKREMDNKLVKMWNEYEKNISFTSSQDLEEVLKNKMEEAAEIDYGTLKHFPKYHKSVLELFSREAIVVLGETQKYVDPVSKMEIKFPLRNKICGHIYDKDTILSLLKQKKEIACPCLGCSCRSFNKSHLEEDENLTEKITQSLNKQASTSREQTMDLNATAEYLDSDNE